MGTVPPTARQEFRKSEIKYRKFLNRYEIWLKQNKPLPKQAPQHVGVIEVGEVYTRVIQGGKEYMRILMVLVVMIGFFLAGIVLYPDRYNINVKL